MLPFRNRTEAGQMLGQEVRKTIQDKSAIVLALPRGGVPVGYEVATALNSDFDVFAVRKIGAPGQQELAIGAIASGNVEVLNASLIGELQISGEVITRAIIRESQELARQEKSYRQNRPAIAITDRTVILVDDGLATGATMLAGIRALRQRNPKRLVVAVPVGSTQACSELRSEADELICLAIPNQFTSVGSWYEDFSQVSDLEVEALLAKSER